MAKKKINDFERFVKESERIRKRPISPEDIERINEISKRVEIEEGQESEDEIDIPAVAKEREKSENTRL